MHQLFRYILVILSLTLCSEVFATTKITSPTESTGVISPEVNTSLFQDNSKISSSGASESTSDAQLKDDASKKDKEKTMNDINTFLIESYKLKIDRILANLNLSLERITNNDPVAQAKLLEKIRNDIDIKIKVINSRSISENRKKILSSVFSYIQENLDAKISKLVQDK